MTTGATHTGVRPRLDQHPLEWEQRGGTDQGRVWPSPVSAADLAGIVELARPVFSPDGQWVAVIRRDPAEPAPDLFLTPVETDPVSGPATGRNRSKTWAVHGYDAGPCWSADSGVVVVAVRSRSAAGSTLLCRRVPDGESWQVELSGSMGRVRQVIGHPLRADVVLVLGDEPCGVISAQRNGSPAIRQPGRLFLVDVNSGIAMPAPSAGVPRGPGADETPLDILAAAVAPDGEQAAVLVAGEDGHDGASLALLDLTSGRVRTLCASACRPTTRDQTLEVSPDGRHVLFSYGSDALGHRAAVMPVSGGPVRTLFADDAGTVLAATWASERSVLAQVFARTSSWLIEADIHDESRRRLEEIGTGQPRFSYSRVSGGWATVAGTAHDGEELRIRQLGQPPRRLSHTNPWLHRRRTGAVREVSWTSMHDGVEVSGLLVSPPGRRGEPGRLVVNVHGGPHFHWSSGWLGSWVDWAQLLAGRGFEVFLPNPRGSTGRGWDFAHAVRGRLGTLPLGDILDGVNAMVDRGVADPHAVGIGGWSYGGYLTAWAITQTQRFAAAVVGAGISDYYSFLGTSPMGPAWERFVPDGRYPERTAFDAVSPVSHLSQCVTPTLVIHGEQDRKIPAEQGRLLHRGLRALGVPTELQLLPGEGHVIEAPAARERLLDAMLTWFDHHLPT
ncbi:S9 family peptidase [Phytoactinopolyspora mesophila]|uniref:Prolyl oligopeptidase family serine peptidase n=1 Tax=Phytoactinopolyspora mesophila TaxID=2650750 RepID=A0A7K3M0N5_9ACTN|nr:prolyl oligopeptidase family serine peptidase [Phytoactinopolyspora mesophila]NDL56865.1 prolyl oligopeptidase family serine peptidase [Phytoactinopolyspora mesophila]